MMPEYRKIAIIGAGPSGCTCAVQLKRYGLDFFLFEKEEIGGLLRNANLIENYAGFPQGISGRKMVKLLKKQLQNFQIKTQKENIANIDFKEGRFLIESKNNIFHSEYLVIASGTRPKKIPELILQEEIKDYVFYEVFHLVGLQNKKIAVIGAGDAAFDYAINLSAKNEVVILNRSDKKRCLSLLDKRVRSNPKINYMANTKVKKIKTESENLLLTCEILNGEIEIKCNFLLVAIGREPELSFLADNLLHSEEKLLKMGKLFFAGDVINGRYRQTSISAGDGMRTAMSIYHNITGRNK